MSRRQTMAVLPRSMRGLSLIELMIAMLIGLMVVGSAIGVFVSNQQTYRATEALARVQESARVGFELMAREVREAGGNACGKDLPVANVLNNAGTTWWSNWANGVVGYDNGAHADSVADTDAIELLSATSGGVTVVTTPSTSSANFKVNTNDHGFEDGDILMVCDYSQASIFQATNVNTSNVTIVHNTGGSVTPGNCAKGLGLPVPEDCGGGGSGGEDDAGGGNGNGNGGGGAGGGGGAPNGTPKIYDVNSKIVEFKASRWFVAGNDRGGRSLYRIVMRQGADQPREEITEGVQDMQITYLLRGATSYVDASAGLDWQEVVAVRITLTVVSQNRVGTDGEVLEREIQHVVTLRNRTA